MKENTIQEDEQRSSKSTRRLFLPVFLLGAAQIVGFSALAWAQRRGKGRGRGRMQGKGGMRNSGTGSRGGNRGGRGGGRNNANNKADQTLIRTLLQNRRQIRRQVKNTPNGVETWTETNNPQLRAVLVRHVKSMKSRVEKVQPIHVRDPLFAALFRNAKKISKMDVNVTAKGVHVIETSNDPFTVKLIQAHARVVSLFIKNGPLEVRKNHAVPN